MSRCFGQYWTGPAVSRLSESRPREMRLASNPFVGESLNSVTALSVDVPYEFARADVSEKAEGCTWYYDCIGL